MTRVNSQKCFAIFVDETADVPHIKQVSLCVRYLGIESKILREEFLIPTVNTTGKGSANLILQSLNVWD